MAQNNFLYRFPDGVFHDILFHFLDITDITKLEGTGKIALNRQIKQLAKGAMRMNGVPDLITPSRILENLFKRWYFLDRVSILAGEKSMNFCHLKHLQVQAIVMKSLTIPAEGTFQEKMLLLYASKELKQLQCSNRYVRNVEFLKGASVDRVTTLSFSRCYELIELSHPVMSQFRSLTSLSLSYCYQLRDPALVLILQNASRLVSLDISYCEMITNRSMREIIQYHTHMERLDVTGCHLITTSYIGRMYDICKELKIYEHTPPAPPPRQTVRALNQWYHWVLAVFYSLEYLIMRSEGEMILVTSLALFSTVWFHYFVGLYECFDSLFCFLLYNVYLVLVYLAILTTIYIKIRELRFPLAVRFSLMSLIVLGWLLLPTVLTPFMVEKVRKVIPLRFYGKFAHGWF